MSYMLTGNIEQYTFTRHCKNVHVKRLYLQAGSSERTGRKPLAINWINHERRINTVNCTYQGGPKINLFVLQHYFKKNDKSFQYLASVYEIFSFQTRLSVQLWLCHPGCVSSPRFLKRTITQGSALINHQCLVALTNVFVYISYVMFVSLQSSRHVLLCLSFQTIYRAVI